MVMMLIGFENKCKAIFIRQVLFFILCIKQMASLSIKMMIRSENMV